MPPDGQLDALTAPRAVRALKALNAEQPGCLKAAHAAIGTPAQVALQRALSVSSPNCVAAV